MRLRSKQKNKLIMEYIRISGAVSFLYKMLNRSNNADVLNSLYQKYLNLSRVYEKLFFKYDMLDLSFSLLKRELNSQTMLDIGIEPNNLIYILGRAYTSYEQTLREELDASRFNEFEKYYILST